MGTESFYWCKLLYAFLNSFYLLVYFQELKSIWETISYLKIWKICMNRFAICMHIESSDCIAKTDNSVCQLHLSKKKKKKERNWCLGLAPGESDLTDPWSIQILGLLKTSSDSIPLCSQAWIIPDDWVHALRRRSFPS